MEMKEIRKRLTAIDRQIDEAQRRPDVSAEVIAELDLERQQLEREQDRLIACAEAKELLQ